MTPVAHLRINLERCEGHAMCAQSAPAFVTMDDEGYPQIERAAVPNPTPTEIDLAVRACPTSSVSVHESAAG